jgi:hypothetical protein
VLGSCEFCKKPCFGKGGKCIDPPSDSQFLKDNLFCATPGIQNDDLVQYYFEQRQSFKVEMEERKKNNMLEYLFSLYRIYVRRNISITNGKE